MRHTAISVYRHGMVTHIFIIPHRAASERHIGSATSIIASTHTGQGSRVITRPGKKVAYIQGGEMSVLMITD